MAGCKKQIVTDYNGREIKLVCGQSYWPDTDGTLVLCQECETELEERYPQGWCDVPGDTCVHGTYVGDAGGPDYICGYCEQGVRLEEIEAQQRADEWRNSPLGAYVSFRQSGYTPRQAALRTIVKSITLQNADEIQGRFERIYHQEATQ